MIPYGRHLIDEDNIQAVTDVLRKGPITQGEIESDLGQALADCTGTDYGTAVSSGAVVLNLSEATPDIGVQAMMCDNHSDHVRCYRQCGYSSGCGYTICTWL